MSNFFFYFVETVYLFSFFFFLFYSCANRTQDYLFIFLPTRQNSVLNNLEKIDMRLKKKLLLGFAVFVIDWKLFIVYIWLLKISVFNLLMIIFVLYREQQERQALPAQWVLLDCLAHPDLQWVSYCFAIFSCGFVNA